MQIHSVVHEDNAINLIPSRQLEGSGEAYKLNGNFLVSFSLYELINRASSQREIKQVLESIPVVDLDEIENREEIFSGFPSTVGPPLPRVPSCVSAVCC
jgi:hypothetical protein